jgi:hypothetical protein
MNMMRMPGLSAFEIQTFACAGCRQSYYAAAIEGDPMTSAAVFWLDSQDLRPPT